MPFVIISGTVNWVPPYSLIYIVLIIGAPLTAGVAMSAFTFYEDYYWGDKDFRDQLRFINLKRNSSNRKAQKI